MRTAEAPRAALASAFAAYLAFIAYQSLAGAAPGACVVPLVQQGSHLSRSDGLANLVAYVPLGGRSDLRDASLFVQLNGCISGNISTFPIHLFR